MGSVQFFRKQLPLKLSGCLSLLSEYASEAKFKVDSEMEQCFNTIREGLINLGTTKPSSDSINILFSDASLNFYGGVLVNVAQENIFDTKLKFEIQISTEKWDPSLFVIKNEWGRNLKVIGSNQSIFPLIHEFLEKIEVVNVGFSEFTREILRRVFLSGREFEKSVPIECPDKKRHFFSRIFQAYIGTKPIRDLFSTEELSILEHYLLYEIVRYCNRQIIFIEKENFFYFGEPKFRSPILIGKGVSSKYVLLSSEKPFLTFPPSLTKYFENLPVPTILKLLKNRSNRTQKILS